MDLKEIEKIIGLYADPALVVDGQCRVLFYNDEARGRLVIDGATTQQGFTLFDCVSEPREEIEDFIRACMRTSEHSKARFTPKISTESNGPAICLGIVIRRESDPSKNWILIRCTGADTINSNFPVLTRTVEDLMREVAHRRAAEERLHVQADIIDQVHDSIVSLDLDGFVTSWNKGAERIFGYVQAEAIGRHISFIYPPEKMDFLKNGILRPLKEKGIHEVDHNEVVRKSGDSFFVHLSLSMLRDDSGTPIGMIGYSMDITERKEAEEALSRSETSLLEAQRVAHVGNWDWNIETGELFWSDEIFRIFGLAPQQFGVTYEAFLQTIHPEDRESVERAVNDAVYEGKEYDIDHRIVLPTEEVRTVHERGEVTFDSDGSPVRMIGTVQDITERREAELALKQSERQIAQSLAEKEVLLKEMHHRVKNNLQVISSLLNLQSAQIQDEKVEGILAESISRVSAMALIHEKLYRSGDLARVDFADYLESLIDVTSETYSILEPSVKFELSDQDVYLDIDTAIPCALIANELVSNALKHAFRDDHPTTNGPPKINVKMARDGGNGFTLSVSDNGCGFPEDIDFRNTESLGLQIVNTLTEQLDGIIEQNNVGGATFTLRFEEGKQKAGG